MILGKARRADPRSRQVSRGAPARPRRSLSPASATTPAVDVRSTPSLTDTGCAPARVSSSRSSAEMPPSGPMMINTVPALGRSTSVIECSASSCNIKVRSAPATRWLSSRVVTGSDTCGTLSRRDCLAASRTVARHLFRDRTPRSSDQRTIDRDACHGTISVTPISVIISTASSDLSPLASA